MKRLSILGSTGSIGCNVLEIVDRFPEKFAIEVLSSGTNVALLSEQVKRFRPACATVLDASSARALKKLIPGTVETKILYGEEGYAAAATHSKTDMVISAIVGAAGLMPTIAALKAGKDVALANKETLVMAGDIVMRLAKEKNITILPIDSEHSAIFQCLLGHPKEDLERLILTASGGPFLNTPQNIFKEITPEKALDHPTWQMGKKISIDSATLMNKGLEVIEAKYLFDVSHKKIDVMVHPQSIVHSMVAYSDGSMIAQLGIPDMKGAIAYAMSFPDRLPLQQPLPDLTSLGALTFEKPNLEKFTCLALAYEACRIGGTLPAVLNAANEIAVHAFLEKRLRFVDIPAVIQTTMNCHTVTPHPSLADIIKADHWARDHAAKEIVSNG